MNRNILFNNKNIQYDKKCDFDIINFYDDTRINTYN